MTVSAEAVEAAAKATYDLIDSRFTVQDPWHSLPEGTKDILREEARAALTAATPIIRAEALRGAAAEVESIIARGDIADMCGTECSSPVMLREELYNNPSGWLRARAEEEGQE